MQAYKLKGQIDTAGNLVITEPIKMQPGDVEVIVLQLVPPVGENVTVTETEFQAQIPKKKVQYRTKAFRDLLENTPPVRADFDPEQARWEALKEKYDL
jgi:hypothetical protein